MRDSATPNRDAPLRRLAFLGLVFVAAIVSCGKDLTGPNGARFMRGFSWNALFPPALRNAGVSSGVVDFNRVHVVLHHSDGTVALDTVIAFPSGADSLTVSLTVELLNNAPTGGEPMTLSLGYLNAAGDTVFKGGPIAITAAPRPPGGGVNPPVQIPVAYTGPGASATAVVIAPRTTTVAGGAGFTFTAVAKDAAGDTLAGTPVIWTSLDPTIATITAPAAGTGVALNVRGTARILAQLLTGATDTAQLIVTLPASQLIKPAGSGDAQSGTATLALAQPIVAKVAASDGVGVAGTTVTFAVASGGGAVLPTSAVTDANGLATTTWTLGPTVGAQSITATAGTLTGSPLTYTATAASSGAGLRTWTGATSTAWTTASNWSPAIVPAAGDSVFVPLTANLPALSSATTIKSLTLAPSAALTFTSATLTLTGSLDATGTIVGTGTVALNSATAATVKGTLATALQVAGLYTVTGTLAANSLQVTNSGSVDINGQTVAIAAGGISTASTATITMTQAAGTLGTTGPASFGGGDETGKLTAGSLSVGGNFAEGGGNAGAFNAGPSLQLVISGSAATTLSVADPTTSLIGNLSIANTAGVTALTTFSANNVTLASGALSGTSGATINGTLTDPLAHWAAGNIVFSTSTTPVSSSTTSITAGQVTFNTNPSALAGNLTVNGNVSITGSFAPNGHTLTVNGAFATSGNGQLTMSGGSDVVTVSGNVTFGSTTGGGAMSAGTLNIGGNLTQSGSSQSLSTSGTNTIVFNGAGTQTVSFGTPDISFTTSCASACFENLTVNKTAGQLNILSGAKVQGNFVNSSTTPVQTPASNGAFVVAGNATFGQNGSFFRIGVGGTFSKGAGTVIDSVTYFGAAQPYNPATLGEVYSEIRGTSNWTSPGTLTGTMVLSNAGQLNVATSAVVTGAFTSSGTSTLKMTTNTTDTLAIGGVATFGGGATTGLLTTGNMVISGASINVTGLAIDASGTYTTTFNATSGTQTLNWTAPVAGKGYNNITLRGAAQRQFGGPQTVVGNMLIAATSGNVNGSFVLTFGGNITDSTAGRNAWNGSSLVVLTGTPTVLPRNFGVNTLTFSGGTVSLTDSLKSVGNIVVDGATAHLKLNGHYVGLSSNFTTQNGGVLEMTNTRDTLDVAGGVTFNGGNTSGLLTHGFMNVGSPGFTQGVNATAFVADSTLRVSVGRGSGTQITFANPGFGPTLSHFGELMIGDGSTHTLNSNVFVQGQLTTAAGPQFPVTSANQIITAQGANATNLFLTNTRLLLVDGSRVTTMTNVQFLSMDPTVTQFEVQRSGTVGTGDFAATLSAPVFNTTPTTGLYLKATDTNGATPFVTINVTTPNPASAGTFVSALSGAVINGWPATATAFAIKTGTWSDPTVWSTSVVPSSSDDVIIQQTFTVTVSSNAVAHNLSVNSGGVLTLSGANTLTVGGTPTNSGTTNCTADNIVLTGTVTLSGSWCGLRTTGTVTLGGSLTVGLLNIAGGTVSNGGITLNATTLQTTGSGTLGMLSANANVNVTGNASFNGGVETGLLTSGTLTIGGNFSAGTGAMFDASSAHTTAFAGSASQTIGWTTPAANIGFGSVTFNHSWPRQFTSDVFIGGTVQIFSSDTVSQQGGTAFISGAHRVTLGGTNQGISDGSIGGPAWRVGATNFALPGASLATTAFNSLSGTDTTIFSGGGTVTVPPGAASKFVLLTKNVIVDNNTKLNLNGGLLNTQGNSFTTQNGGTLKMSAFSNDSLNAGHVYFNGGATDTLLLGGGMAVTGLYQGFTPAFTAASGASPTAFAPAAGLHTYLTGTAPDTVAFANPGTGAAGSHFYFLQNRLSGAGGPVPPAVLRTDIFVDSILVGDFNNNIYNSDALNTTARKITMKAFNNSGTTSLTFGAVTLQLNDGAPSGFANSLNWISFPASFTGILYTQNRSSSSGPSIGNSNYSTVTFDSGGVGQFVKNLGTQNLVTGTNTPTTCNSRTLTIGQSCK